MCIWRGFYFTGKESPLLPSHPAERLRVLPSNRVLSEVEGKEKLGNVISFLIFIPFHLIFPIGGNAMSCLKEHLRELPTRLNSSITAFGNSFPSFLKDKNCLTDTAWSSSQCFVNSSTAITIKNTKRRAMAYQDSWAPSAHLGTLTKSAADSCPAMVLLRRPAFWNRHFWKQVTCHWLLSAEMANEMLSFPGRSCTMMQFSCPLLRYHCVC